MNLPCHNRPFTWLSTRRTQSAGRALLLLLLLLGATSARAADFVVRTVNNEFAYTTTAPPSPPTVGTVDASNLGGASATLNASINPNGVATTGSFIYGTDPALQTGTTTTAGQVIGSGNAAIPVTAAIAGLQPVTTYYFQAQATSSAGSNQGSILSFTTLSTDATLSGLALSQGTMGSAFDPGTLAYAVLVANPVTSLTITPTSNESHATTKVNGTPVASGAASSPVSLSVGANVITVLVTAQDGVTTESYTVTVTRAAFNSTDYSFGVYGQAVTNAGPFAQARGVVIQPDGKIIAVGTGETNNSLDFIVARYNTDGSLDTTFQSTGKVSTDFGGLDDEAQSVALQGDGKIVVAGYTNANSSHYQFALARYNTNGSLDTTFNTTGKLIPSFGTSFERGAGVAVQKDGRIIVVGAVTVGSKGAMAVARFNSDGSPDTTFNVTGQLIAPAGTDSASGTSVVVQPDGAILVGGSSNPSAGGGHMAVWRFHADGTTDTTFGGTGEVTTVVGTGSSGASMALQRDGRIVLAGSATVNAAGNIAVVRYNGDGSLDTTFNTTGKATTQVSGSASTGSSVVVQADGKIAVAGTAVLGGQDDIALVRFNANGSLDTTFNITGWVTTDLGGFDLGQGLALQRDGKLVVVGKSGLGNYDFAVLRYNSGLTVAPFTWGYDNLGQLGDDNAGSTSARPVEVLLIGALAGKTVVSVAPGIYHTVALCADGTVACWGSNYSGELGNNTTTPSAVPVAVDTSANSALHNKTVIAIAAGSSHSLALCSDGTVAAWGAGGYGQLGNTQGIDSPIPVAMYAGAGSSIQGKTVVAMAGGHYHTYLLCSDGTVSGCGFNFGGQIGTGSSSPIFVTYPTAITTTAGSALAGKTVVSIATGLYHGLALCSDGTIAGWGRDLEGQLGDGNVGTAFTPVAVNMTSGLLAGKTVLGIAAGGLHSLALCSDGTIAAWGSNSAGQLGNGASGFDPVTAPVAVDTSGVLSGKTVVSLIAGTNNSFALCSNGAIASWGDNTSGELGDGSAVTEIHTPVLVDTSPLAAVGATFISLASGPDAFHETAMVALPPAPKIIVLSASGALIHNNSGTVILPDAALGSSGSPQSFTIQNAGSADLTGIAVSETAAGNPADFTLNTTGLPASLAPGATATFTVTFSPSGKGLRTALAQIASNDANATPFGILFSGQETSSDASLASLVPGVGSLAPVFDSATLSYTATLPAGTTDLSLTPMVAQTGATVTINGVAVVSGSASAPLHLHGGTNAIMVVVTGSDGTTTKTYTVDATANGPHIVVEEPLGTELPFGSASVDFGAVAPGSSASEDITIRSAGTQDLTGVGVTIDGANAAEFSVTVNPATSVTAGSTTSVTVKLTPTSTGAKSATLHIASNDPDEPSFAVSLTGRTHAVSFDEDSLQQVEAAVTLTVPVRLSSAFGKTFTVPVTFLETPNLSDYTASASPLTFSAVQTVANITITLKNNTVVTGDRTLTVTLGQPSNLGVSLGAFPVFTLKILEDDIAPVISPQPLPLSQIVARGDSATFTSGATGSPPLTLQWKRNGLILPGATTGSLTIPSVALTDGGSYTLTASNHHPAVTSSAVQLAVVDTTPSTLRLNTGTAATMTVGTGGTPLTYKWRKGGQDLPITGTKYAGVLTKTLTVKTLVGGDAGTYTCTVTSPAGSLSSGTFTLEVPTAAPTATIPSFPDGVSNNAYSYQLPYDGLVGDENQVPTKFVCSGLPTGLSCNASTGLITGKPTTPITTATTYNVKVTLSNSAGSTAIPSVANPGTLTLKVWPFPSACAGAYVGLMGRDTINSNLGGRVDLTTTSTGSYTGTLKLGASSYTLAPGTTVTAPPTIATPNPHPGATLTIARTGTTSVVLILDLDPTTNLLTGSVNVLSSATLVPISGWRNIWRTATPANLAAQAGNHAFNLAIDAGDFGAPGVPQGYGYGTITVTTAGGTTVTGHTADGGAITTNTGILGPNGEAVVYQMLYSNKGSVLGSVVIAGDTQHNITGTLDWQKSAVVLPHDYGAFGPVSLMMSGGKYVYTSTAALLGPVSPSGSDAGLVFDQGGLPGGSLTNPNVQLHISSANVITFPAAGVSNPGKITSLTLTTATGAFNGKFTLTDGSVSRGVLFQGQMVPSLGKGYGYFLLPGLAPSVTTSPILSGSVLLEAVGGRLP